MDRAAQASAPGGPLGVLLIDRGLNFHGGISKALLGLAQHADPARLRLELATLEPPSPDMAATFSALDVPLHWLGDRSRLRSALALRRLLRARRLRLVVANSLRAYLVTKLATAGLRCRVVYWVHAAAELRRPLKALAFARLSRTDTLLFPSQAMARELLPPHRRGRWRVIYHGVEEAGQEGRWVPYDRTRRADLGLAEDDLVLGYVGSFEPYKDQATLLRAFDRLWREEPRLQLLLIGQGAGRPAVQALAGALPSGARVHFLGAREDARALLGLLDVYVHPCYVEAFGLAVVEAMLAGRPVVVAAGAGLLEVVRDRQTGLHFAARDPADLARQLRALLADPGWAAQLAEAGRADAARRFAPARFAEEVTRLLEEERRPPAPREERG